MGGETVPFGIRLGMDDVVFVSREDIPDGVTGKKVGLVCPECDRALVLWRHRKDGSGAPWYLCLHRTSVLRSRGSCSKRQCLVCTSRRWRSVRIRRSMVTNSHHIGGFMGVK